MADAEVLKAAGLQGWHSGLAATVVWCAVIGAIFGAISAAAALANHLIEQHAERVALKQEGLHNPLWLQSERGLRSLHFERQKPIGDLTLFVRTPKPASDSVPLVEVVVRRDDTTVAVVQVLAVDARESWEFGRHDLMTDGSTVAEAVTKSNIPLWLAERTNDAIDVIAVGLESRPRRETPAQPQDEKSKPIERESLSVQRATALATDFRRIVGFIEGRPVHYWTLDLGRATVPSERGQSLEVRQRAAIMVALSRRRVVEGGPITRESVLALITTNVEVYGTDLRSFQHSQEPSTHLRPL